jgi:hypothetical protein
MKLCTYVRSAHLSLLFFKEGRLRVLLMVKQAVVSVIGVRVRVRLRVIVSVRVMVRLALVSRIGVTVRIRVNSNPNSNAILIQTVTLTLIPLGKTFSMMGCKPEDPGSVTENAGQDQDRVRLQLGLDLGLASG